MTLVYKLLMVLVLCVGVLCVDILLVHFMQERKKRRH